MEYKGAILYKGEYEIVVRSAKIEDAPLIVRYNKESNDESRFPVSEEFELPSLEEEVEIIKSFAEDPRAAMLVAKDKNIIIGNCSFTAIDNRRKHQHRCMMGIALLEKYTSMHIGSEMLEIVMSLAKMSGYEQMELEVIEGNDRAKRMYEKYGFEVYGKNDSSTKNSDGSYMNSLYMSKRL